MSITTVPFDSAVKVEVVHVPAPRARKLAPEPPGASASALLSAAAGPSSVNDGAAPEAGEQPSAREGCFGGFAALMGR